MKEIPQSSFNALSHSLLGELYYKNNSEHNAYKRIYATDASIYQELPIAVAIPRDINDIKQLIAFAIKEKTTLIPRAAGTSLAGQVVGNGIVVDISVHFTNIIEVNTSERWVKVQPGVIRDDLNTFLKPYGLMYAPETSTASRAMIGGMIGNNSCGLHSIVWGDTRQHIQALNVLLADGSEAILAPSAKNNSPLLEHITTQLENLITAPVNREVLKNSYPSPTLTRRNTGYALDLLAARYEKSHSIDLCTLLAGSEGTLAFITEATLNLIPLPPPCAGIVCIHCHSIIEAMHANNVALKHMPMASELVDKFIMDFTVGHLTYKHTRFFIEGDPQAILMVEFLENTVEEVEEKAHALTSQLRQLNIGYAYPLVQGADCSKVWDLRKAGLGLIRNMPGDSQPVNLIEDCAVPPEQLPMYVADIQSILEKHNVKASYYAHAGAGELHIEPMLNLKTSKGQQAFRTILQETATLVKKYKGSLSGEHGDGRLRGEFIAHVLGADVYELLKQVKQLFDPQHIFNAGKIVGTPPMDSHLRYTANQAVQPITTFYDFSNPGSILKLAEKCSGSGDCRRTHLSGGTMCPSYMATRQEKNTTRARANILRQFLTSDTNQNALAHHEIKEVMDLCLSCKACKSECPSSVDVTKMKAEFLQHYYDAHHIPLRARLIAHFADIQKLMQPIAFLYNAIGQNKFLSRVVKQVAGFHKNRSLPILYRKSLRSWYQSRIKKQSANKVLLFCDEFTNYNDVPIGQNAILLLEALGYEVIIPNHGESGRTYLSKGLVRSAKKIINKNIELLSPLVTENMPMVGIEPSAILTFKDEALDLCLPANKKAAQHIASHTYGIEEFIAKEYAEGKISREHFTEEKKEIHVHGHCYQKALGSLPHVLECLSIPKNYMVHNLPTGCCGMAGSFGYEKEHFEVSMQVANLVLLPHIKKQQASVVTVAPGTSCRHQIKDGAHVKALHPVEILYSALVK